MIKKMIKSNAIFRKKQEVVNNYYKKVFDKKNGAFHTLLYELKFLIHNMEKYNDISLSPLTTMKRFMEIIIDFKTSCMPEINYLQKTFYLDAKKWIKINSLSKVMKDWLKSNGITLDKDENKPIEERVYLRFHDRSILTLNELYKKTLDYKKSQMKMAILQKSSFEKEIKDGQIYLLPKINHLRMVMITMVQELEKIQHEKKQFHLF